MTSKRKFNPENLNNYDFERYIDIDKIEEQATFLSDFTHENIKIEVVNAFQHLSIIRFVSYLSKRTAKLLNRNSKVVIRYYSIHFPEFQIKDALNFIDQSYREEFPFKELKKYFKSKIEIVKSQNFESPENKKFIHVLSIDVNKIIFFLEDHFFFKKCFEFFSPKNSVNDLIDSIFNKKINEYFLVKNQKIEMVIGNERHTINDQHFLWDSIKKEYITPALKAFLTGKEMHFTDEFTEVQFDSMLLYLKEFLTEIKKINIEYQSLMNIQDFIVFKEGASENNKNLILHDVLSILYANNFTSISKYKEEIGDPYTSKGFIGKDLKERMIHEVKKFLSLY